MPIVHQCDRCGQPFSSAYRVKAHKMKKTPCLAVDLPLDEAIAEHVRLTKTLSNVAEELPPGELKDEVVQENKDQKQELAIMYKESAEARTGMRGRPVARPLASLNIDYSSTVKLKLDPKTGNSTVIFGSSKSGKSTVLMKIFEKYYDNDSVSVLMTESPQLRLYRNKHLLVAPTFMPEVVREMHQINKKTKNHYRFNVFLDDITTEKDNIVLRKLILVLRNSNISSIVSLQGTRLLNKQNRGSVNNYLLFAFNTAEAIRDVIGLFLVNHLPGTMDQKIDVYRRITSNHGFIYYNPREDSVSYHRLSL